MWGYPTIFPGILHKINLMLQTSGKAFFVCLLILAQRSISTCGKKQNKSYNLKKKKNQ